MAERLFFRPRDGWVGDMIPYHDGDQFRLFYLKTRREGPMFSDIGWHRVDTRDFVHFTDQGDMDIHGGTGSVIERGGVYHLFYCDNDLSDVQYVCHAVSRDLTNWEKLPEDTFSAAEELYERRNFRDPHVFWHEEAGEYRMLLATRTAQGPTNRRGCTGMYASDDLHSWRPMPPLYAPGIDVGAHECPDIFRIGDWWYLTYSTYTDFYATVYRMSRSPDGPFTIPLEETLEGRAFYAGKTAAFGSERYLLGWNPSREGQYFTGWNPSEYPGKDLNIFDWGGNLVVHRLVQRPDGTLYCALPERVGHAFSRELPVEPTPVQGRWEGLQTRDDSFSALFLGDMVNCGSLEFKLRFTDQFRRCGVALHADAGLDEAYYITLDRQYERLSFATPIMQQEEGWRVFPHMAELQRPLKLIPGETYDVRILCEGSVVLVYVDGRTALSARMYDRTGGKLALFALGEGTRISDVRYREYH